MNTPLILHIPHARLSIPKQFMCDYTISENQIEEVNHKMSDLHTDTLFGSTDQIHDRIVFQYSRLFVDVERFREDEDERMADRGMGALYTHGHKLQRIRKDMPARERESILVDYYDAHHSKLEHMVTKHLKHGAQPLIVDCHSFPKDRLPYEDTAGRDRPEICIGSDDFHTPEELLELTSMFFLKNGFTVGLNNPFSGTIVPLRYYGKERRVQSIMIEVRRDLFLEPNLVTKNSNFNDVRKMLTKLLHEPSNHIKTREAL